MPLRRIVFVTTALLSLTPFVSGALALLMGLIVAQLCGQPFLQLNHKTTQTLLQVTVAMLGFGVDVHQAWQVGSDGFVWIISAIAVTIISGIAIGKIFSVKGKTSFLISVGTAICGGSAIAAISPVIQSGRKETSVALGIIFILNAAGLLVFPLVGEWLQLSQYQFGMWSAVAIHDTSAVVSAAGKFGCEALQVATTLKLTRALFIVPMVMITALTFKNSHYRIKTPWFILFFVLAAVMNTYISGVQRLSPVLTHIAKACLTCTLFLIGTNLSWSTLRQVGWRPFLQGTILWLLVSGASLAMIVI